MRLRVSGLLALLVLVLLWAPASRAERALGLGVMAGDPTAVSGKMWLNETSALDAALGWSFVDDGRVYLHVDYLWHSYDLEPEDFDGRLPYYLGVGGRLLAREGHESRLGVRFPIGLDYVLGDGRFDVFVELAPVFDLAPKTDLSVGGGVGVRFFF